MNDGQIPNFRVERVPVSTGYNRVEGNRQASRNGRVSDLPPEIPNVTIRNFLHRRLSLVAAATQATAGVGLQALSTMGQTLRLDANSIALSFADETMENLHTRFYRSKLTSWMSHQEDFYRFILLEADPTGNPLWTRVCVSQVPP